MKLTRRQLRKLILEVMIKPSDLILTLLDDPDIDPKIKKLLSHPDIKNRKTGLELARQIYSQYEERIQHEGEYAAAAHTEWEGPSTWDPMAHTDWEGHKQATGEYEYSIASQGRQAASKNFAIRKFVENNNMRNVRIIDVTAMEGSGGGLYPMYQVDENGHMTVIVEDVGDIVYDYFDALPQGTYMWQGRHYGMTGHEFGEGTIV